MSAWIVTKAHIDALVQALTVEGLVPVSDATKTGQMLWDENYASINARYRETEKAPRYKFKGVEAPLHDAAIVRQARCYDYQTCEHAEWEGSEARRLVDALVAKLEARNGGEDFDRAYEAASKCRLPWGIDDLSEVLASAFT
jgi:hypothetical protein